MIVQLRLFAAARQAAGSETVHVELPAEATVADLRTALVRQVPALAAWRKHLMIAVDQQYAGDEHTLTEGAEVACFPPVSGG